MKMMMNNVSILVLVECGFLPVLTFNLVFPIPLPYYIIKPLMIYSPIFMQNHVFFDVFRNFLASVYIVNTGLCDYTFFIFKKIGPLI